MSEQRKMRSELRQGLHQFLMQLYQSYSQSLDKNLVVEQIVGVLNEQHEYFTGQSMTTSNLEETMKEIAIQYEKKAKSATAYEEQMRYHEDLDILLKAQEILARERGNLNG
jgi:hypothetical protein